MYLPINREMWIMGNFMGLSKSEVVFVYYAHPIWMYDTLEEEEAIKSIMEYFGKDYEEVIVINPSEYEKIESFKEIKKVKGMRFCLCLVEMADCLVFQRYKITEDFKKFLEEYMGEVTLDEENVMKEVYKLKKLIRKREVVTPGVAKEVNYALKKSIPVYEVAESGIEEFREGKLKSDIPPPYKDTLYNTFNRLIYAFKTQNLALIKPPFWWLY